MDAGVANKEKASAVREKTGGAEATALQRRDDFDRDLLSILGLPVDIATIDRALAEIDRAVRERRRLSFVTPNVNWLVRAWRDPAARRQIVDADLSLIDGAPLALLAKWLGAPDAQRVAGSDLFEALRRRPAFAGPPIKVFFFGGGEGAAEAAAKTLNAEGGGARAVGWRNPGFGDMEAMSAQSHIDAINDADPDFVVVSLGAAKGQDWIARNQDRLTAPVIAHLGAVVNFTAGGVARAPKIIQRLGLEWAWRIKEEPALWRRYAGDAAALAGLAATRLAPQAFAGRPKASGAASAVVEDAEGAVRIRVTGAAVRGGLADVRAAFRQAAQTGRPARIDISAATAIDRSFLGLLFALEKHAPDLRVEGATKRRDGFLRANGVLSSRANLSKAPRRALAEAA